MILWDRYVEKALESMEESYMYIISHRNSLVKVKTTAGLSGKAQFVSLLLRRGTAVTEGAEIMAIFPVLLDPLLNVLNSDGNLLSVTDTRDDSQINKSICKVRGVSFDVVV